MDIQLHYIEKGKGTPLILLHGNGEDSTYFSNQINYFSKSYRVIAIDTRGHGKTKRGDAPFTIRQFARDLYEFMENKKIKRAHILGFSDGGNIAMIFALRHPEKVDKLILNGANLNAKGVKKKVQIPIVIGYLFAKICGIRSENARLRAEMLGLMVHDPNVAPRELTKIKARTLVVAGTDDMIKEEHIRLFYEGIPNSKLKFIEGDHFIANKNPEEFNKVVAKFLKSEA